MERSTVDAATPMLGGPLPLELANTTYAVRGRLRDGLESPEHLTAWLANVRSRLATPLADADLRAADHAQLTLARDLRDCVRALASTAVDGLRPDAALVDRLNRHARAAPQWRELRWDGDRPHSQRCGDAPAVSTAICEIAQAAVELFASPHRADIRQCGAPGCVLYFLRDHPRREWCSVACGNRVRAARHYQRTKDRPRT
jgi:predicted RNA-binding Zn ribbon-like protein